LRSPTPLTDSPHGKWIPTPVCEAWRIETKFASEFPAELKHGRFSRDINESCVSEDLSCVSEDLRIPALHSLQAFSDTKLTHSRGSWTFANLPNPFLSLLLLKWQCLRQHIERHKLKAKETIQLSLSLSRGAALREVSGCFQG
jgi:hypothetical protein